MTLVGRQETVGVVQCRCSVTISRSGDDPFPSRAVFRQPVGDWVVLNSGGDRTTLSAVPLGGHANSHVA